MRYGFHKRNRKKGAAAVEFALLAPILMLILGGAFDASRYIWYQTDILQALRAGVQYAISDPTNTTQISAAVIGSTRLSASAGWAHQAPDCGCVASTDAVSIPAAWSACSSTPCTSQRRYMRLRASFAYQPLIGNMVGLLPPSAAYTTYLRLQ